MIEERVICWYEKNGILPENILFYRDGVSESQFEMVKNLEYRQVVTGFNNAAKRLQSSSKDVKVTLVVVGKRHHTKFFPDKDVVELEHRDERKYPAVRHLEDKNCPYGLVVDSGIIDPHYFSFYLQSHDSPLGTAKSAHYFVIQNKMELSANELQSFVSYGLIYQLR